MDKLRIILILTLTFFYSQSIFALSSKDIGLYKSVFNDYRNGNFDKGDKDIAKLDDLILLGHVQALNCLLYTSPSPRDVEEYRMPSSA